MLEFNFKREISYLPNVIIQLGISLNLLGHMMGAI